MKDNELKNRREFFKEAAKKALPVIGLVAFSNVLPVLSSCSKENYDCTDCTAECSSGCMTSCEGSSQSYNCAACSSTCSGACKTACTKTPRRARRANAQNKGNARAGSRRGIQKSHLYDSFLDGNHKKDPRTHKSSCHVR